MIIGDMEIRLRADIARLQRDMDSARRVVGDATTSISRAADMAKAALAGIAAGVGLSQLVQMADAYAKFTAQLRLASTSAREYAAAYADVKRIANVSQQGLAETGVLYARIANGTRELGTSQKQVAAITEVVNLALKVSGAAAAESASAQLQLSQAFASGTLRGEEFNAVNEAAPRLMKALADGMGLPVGALKAMAGEGKITSNIMATVLPDALAKLRVEAAEVQTIAGAFTVLKNNLMEMVGVQANASGAVAGLTGAIGLLSSNLAGVAWAMSTMIAIKATNWLAGLAMDARAAAVAKRALAAATLQTAVTTTEAAAVAAAAKFTEAQANMATAASAATLTAARVVELRAAVLAAQGAAALAITTNGLIPAQARAAAAAEAHALALSAQAVAANGAMTASLANTAAITAQATAATLTARAMGFLRGALALVGGPIGAIILALSAGALAWSKWGKDAKESNEMVVESFEEAQARIVKGLDEQIDKNEKLLRLKNLGMTTAGAEKAIPVTDQLGAASRRLNEINTRTGEFSPTASGMSNGAIDREREKTMANIAELTQKMQKVEQTGAAVATQTANERVAAFKKEYATKDEQMKAELKSIEDLKGKTAEYDMMVKRIQDKYADKGNASAIKKEATAYQNLMTAIAEKIGANKLELEVNEKMTESQKMTNRLNAEIKTSKNILSKESIANARAEIAIVAEQEAQIESRAADASRAAESAAANADNAESISKVTAQLRAEALAQQDHNAQIGLGKMALADLEAQRYEHLASLKDENAALAEAIDFSGGMSQAYRDQAAALRERADATRAGAAMELKIDATPAKDLLDIMAALDDAAKSAASGMTASFGQVGSAIGGLTTALTSYGRTQTAIAAQLAAATKDAGGDEGKIKRASAAAAQQSAQAQIRSYGDMASAAKGFFKENSTGYRTMEKAEKAFRAYEMALAIQNMLTKSGLLSAFTALFVTSKATEAAVDGASTTKSVANSMVRAGASLVEGVSKAFAQMGVWGFVGAGAIIAFMGAMGVFGGTGGGGSAPTTFEDRQKKQGTGTVLGDDTAKSESISKSLEIMEQNSDRELGYQNSMLVALRNIETALGGAAKGIFQTAGLTGGSAFGTKESATKETFGSDKSTKITDSGVLFQGLLGALRSGGARGIQYEDVTNTSDGGMFHGNSSNSFTNKKGLADVAMKPFQLIFDNMGDLLVGAGVKLGADGATLTDAINKIGINFSVSTRELKGQELADELAAGVSVAFDQVTKAAFPYVEEFWKFGEGLGETLVRLAANYSALDSSLGSIGMTFGATGVSSLAAREKLIEMAGGIDKLSDQTSSFAENFLTEGERLAPIQKHVTEQLTLLGQAGIKTRDDFKTAVLGLSESGKLATKEGRELFSGLMALESAFAAVVPALEKTKTAAEKKSEREGLIDQRDDLKMKPEDLAKKRKEKFDESNWDVYDEIVATELANKNRALEIQNLELAGNKVGALAAKRADEMIGLDASTAQIIKRRHALEDESAVAALASKNRSIEIQNMELMGDKIGALAATRALEVVGLDASTVALIKNRNALQDQAAAATNAVAGANTALANVKTAVDLNKTSLEEAYKRHVEDLKAISDQTKDQISAVKTRTDAVQDVFDKLNDALASTVIQVDYFDAAQRRSAQELLARAAITTRGGGTADIKGLDDALSVIAKPSQQLFSSFEDWARDQARTASSIATLKENAKDEINFASLTVDAIHKAAGAAQAGSEANLKLLAEQHKAEMAAQDLIVTNAQTQIDLARGLNTGIMSIAEALKAFGIAVQTVKDNPPPLSVEGLYESVLGRKGDAKGMDFWKKVYGESVDNAEMQDFIKAAKPEMDAKREGNWAQFLRKHGVPGYVSGGDFGGGLRLVGENGPEIEATGPSRIFNADQTRSMMSGGGSADVVAELREVRRELAEMKADSQRTAAATEKSAASGDQLAKQFNNVSSGGNNLRTKAIA